MVRLTDKETVAIEKLVPLPTLAIARKCVMQDHGGKHQSQSGSRESKGEKVVKNLHCDFHSKGKERQRKCYFE